jgi:hypothetical protein
VDTKLVCVSSHDVRIVEKGKITRGIDISADASLKDVHRHTFYQLPAGLKGKFLRTSSAAMKKLFTFPFTNLRGPAS